jgi:hypothetical protein
MMHALRENGGRDFGADIVIRNAGRGQSKVVLPDPFDKARIVT